MALRTMRWIRLLVTFLGLLSAAHVAVAAANTTLAYATVEQAQIKVGESTTIRVTSFDSHLQNIDLPSVPGLTFEMLRRAQGAEFIGGTAVPAIFLDIRVTAQFAGYFTIPPLLPNLKPLGLQVVTDDLPAPQIRYPSQKPTPLPVAPVSLPKGVALAAGGAAFAQLILPARTVYVGESVPVQIVMGIRPGIVTQLNGLPALNGSDFTLNNLSAHPKSRDQTIEGSIFQIWSWNSLIAAIKPGDYRLAVSAPVSARTTALSASDAALASKLQWPFSQLMYNNIAPKDVTITSPASRLQVLPLPTEGQPHDFSGAVGSFQVSSEVSASHAAVGDPITLRLHITGSGNFDRVEATMLARLDHWKTYPAKSSFNHTDEAGYEGDKVFEQTLVASQTGEQTLPALEFNYFDPHTHRYERAQTAPINVSIAVAGTPATPSGTFSARYAQGLRPDHAGLRRRVSTLQPLYFQTSFLALPLALALLLAGYGLIQLRRPTRADSRAAVRAISRLEAAAHAGDSASFFELTRQTLQQTFAARWKMVPTQITLADVRARLGASAEDLEQLWTLADEAKYSVRAEASTDFPRWLAILRTHLMGGNN